MDLDDIGFGEEKKEASD
jgi:hypothetical protein